MCSSAGLKKIKQEEHSDSVAEMQVVRSREPENFLLKVESFSKSKLEKYESDEFESGGYKRRLILYPNGDNSRNGNNHISIYISICDTQNLPPGWEVEADFSIFVYNMTEKTRFNWLKTDSGFAQLMPLEEFKETSNGYLFGDTCVFGAEIHVTDFGAIAKRQTLSMVNETNIIKTNVFTWTVGSFSKCDDARLESNNFTIGDVQWNLRLYPKGNGDGKDKFISVFLALANDEFTILEEDRKTNAECKLRIRNQLASNHVEYAVKFEFSNYMQNTGFAKLMLLSDVNDTSKGFLKNDCVVAEVEFTKVEITRNFK